MEGTNPFLDAIFPPRPPGRWLALFLDPVPSPASILLATIFPHSLLLADLPSFKLRIADKIRVVTCDIEMILKTVPIG
jgi:hypothetical protein